MILQALCELADREGLVEDPDFVIKPVTFLVRVGAGGKFLGFADTRTAPPAQDEEAGGRRGKKKPPPRPKSFPVPREGARTSGDRAFFLVDKAEYVFGIDPDGKREADKLAVRFALFRQKVERCRDATGDEAVAAVADYLESVAAGRQSVTLPEGCAANDLFTFTYELDDELVLERPAVRRYWQGERSVLDEGAEPRPCLVTGELAAPADLHPVLKYVPGASTSGVPLVSFNQAAFESYGWSGNANAGISRRAAEAYAAALQRLLHPAPPNPRHPGETLPRRSLRLGADTAVCFWSRDDGFANLLAGVLEADPDEVANLYTGPWRGRQSQVDDAAAFYALTLSGSQGRVIVRGWFEATVGEVAANLAHHFEDLAIARNTPPRKGEAPPPHLPLRALLDALTPPGRTSNVPGALAEEIFTAALRGTPYPLTVLQRAVLRQRAEMSAGDWGAFERRDARAMLIKAVLNRRLRRGETTAFPEVKNDMDPDNTNPGYRLGRLMALIERIQLLALGDVNASVVDRYFSGASAAPRSVFVRLLKGARHHLRKAKDTEKNRGLVVHYERLLDELLAGFEPGNHFPAHLNLEDQGLFILGYHHQRHDFFRKRGAPEPGDAETGDAEAGDAETGDSELVH